jgi:hypothetical protein
MFDMSDPARPIARASFRLEDWGGPLAVLGERVYTVSSNRILVVNFSNLAQPFLEKTITNAEWPHRIELANGKMFVLLRYNDNFMDVYDLADPANPTKLSRVKLPSYAGSIEVVGTAAYLGDMETIYFWDVSDPAKPVSRGQFAASVDYGMDYRDGKLLVSGSSGLTLFDLTTSFAPVRLTGFAGLPQNRGRVALDGETAYVASYDEGLITVQLTGAAPELPRLEIFAEGETHRVRWPTNYTRYGLFSASTLMGPWTLEQLAPSPTKLFNGGARAESGGDAVL